MELNRIYNEDCLKAAKKIESGSIDLILTDLPYGTIKNMGDKENIKHGMKGKTEWDTSIDPIKIHEIANRVLRRNGKMVLFSQEPYTTKLITLSHKNVPFSYRMVWEKDHFANSLIAKKAPVNYFEDVLVFSKSHDIENLHPLREYFESVMLFIGLSLKDINNVMGHRRAEHCFYTKSTQFSLCTEGTYEDIASRFNLKSMKGYMNYDDLKDINEKYSSVFNLWDGNKFKSNILKYKKDYTGLHPTQKPVLLLEDLIKTFSNHNDTILDLTIGSGSTAIAAINTKRNFIGFELDETYYNLANKRIAEHK